ncbi:hypothetical protein LX36DRAFT_655927 [Colletotrichum falcatum]|nr:hypothetical protein LX36DRAFT_655927 [Colletotrichum falcatum]
MSTLLSALGVLGPATAWTEWGVANVMLGTGQLKCGDQVAVWVLIDHGIPGWVG